MKNNFLLTLLLLLSGATIGNSQVIYEIYSQGGPVGATWMEDAIILQGPPNQSLNGWSLQIGSGNMGVTSWSTKLDFGAGAAFDAQGFFNIEFAGNGTSGATFPWTPDVVSGNQLSNTGGRIALVNDQVLLSTVSCPQGVDPNIVDFVGYGANVGCFEGTAITTLTTAGNQSLRRFQDTNNNAADFAINPNALPVELNTFTATPKGGQVLLQWNTQSERNNDYFSVERSSDGHLFEAIGQVKGNGSSTTLQSYRHSDLHPKNGLNYYRLRQVDYDKKEAYSKVISVLFGQSTRVAVFAPNPSLTGLTRLTYIAGTESTLNLTVRDLSGRTVMQQSREVSEGENQLSLDCSALSKGTYLVEMATNDDTQVQKLVIQ